MHPNVTHESFPSQDYFSQECALIREAIDDNKKDGGLSILP